MSATAARSEVSPPQRAAGELLRVAFAGPRVWLEGCAPPAAGAGIEPRSFAAQERLAERVAEFRPHALVVFDPPAMPLDALRSLEVPSLGVLVGGLPEGFGRAGARALDRLVSFDPALTGKRVGGAKVWRAIPPPVADSLYREAHTRHGAPRAMAVGRSTEHRERMLMPAKHHHDVLQVIHGVSGESLSELLGEYDIGIYVAPDAGGGFGHQVCMHLAAGQLLLSEELRPAHGLERNIDYLQVDSPHGLVWVLERLARFPEMHRRITVRGRLKAEQFRASRLFARLIHDLRLDMAAFGR